MPVDVNRVVPIFNREIDALINSFGRPVRLVFAETILSVPDENFNGVHGGNIKPNFKSGQPTTVENSRIIMALVKWNPKNLEDFGVNVAKGKNVVRIKTFLTNLPDLKRASYIMPDTPAEQMIGARFQLLTDPSPRGLSVSRYCESLWEEI